MNIAKTVIGAYLIAGTVLQLITVAVMIYGHHMLKKYKEPDADKYTIRSMLCRLFDMDQNSKTADLKIVALLLFNIIAWPWQIVAFLIMNRTK